MKDTSGPAFPGWGENGKLEGGMTLRQWYAGQAMKALVTDSTDYSISYICGILGIESMDYDPTEHWPRFVAIKAWKQADAMLAHEAGEECCATLLRFVAIKAWKQADAMLAPEAGEAKP